jgi:LCP family protein required for cell wall assembly
LLIALVIVGVLTAAGVAAVNHGINDRVDNIRRIKLRLAAALPQGYNVLILGSDTRALGDDSSSSSSSSTTDTEFGNPNVITGQRSDTLMVAHVEPAAQRTLVVSFPRDMVVDIPGVGKNKINAAFDNGGPQKVIDTLKADFNIDISHYIQVDFESFQKIVDAIGTVGIYFPLPTRDNPTDPADGGSGFQATAGCNQMTGGEALAYVRARHIQEQNPETGKWVDVFEDAPDIHRIERQQMFIRELASVAIQKSLGDPFAALDIADNALGYLKADTNLSRSDVNSLIEAFRTVDVNNPNSIDFETLPWEVNPSQEFGDSLLPLQPAADQMVAQLETFGDTPPPPAVVPSQVKVNVIDGAGQNYARGVLDALVKQGFVAGDTAATLAPVVPVTEVHYNPSRVAAGDLVLGYVGEAKLIPDPRVKDVDVLLGANFSGSITIPPSATTTTTVPGQTTITTAPPTTTTTTSPPPGTPPPLGSPC